MKILLVASNMVHIKNFHLPYVKAFNDAGHDVRVMASAEGADFNIPFKKKAFSFRNFCLSFKIRKILKREKFDAVLMHTTLAAFWTRFAMIGLKNRPVTVNTVHGYLFSKDSSMLKRKAYLFAEKLMRKRTDYILVMNQEDLEIAKRNKLCKKEVHFINGMGVRLERVEGFEKESYDGADTLRLVYVGEISKRKNQLFLVKALEYLPNATLTLVGDGDQRGVIEDYATEHGVLDRLEITGFTKNVGAHICNADVYTSASTIEGLPFNIIEAMATKIPVLASDIKGQNDLLPGDCLYELNNMDAFVEAIKSISLAPRSYDIEKYKVENVLSENVRLYLDLIKNEQIGG